MKVDAASVEKGSIKLIEYIDPTFNYEDKIFIQAGCVGFYLTPKELRDLRSVIEYYLNAEDYTDIRVKVGGEYVALQ